MTRAPGIKFTRKTKATRFKLCGGRCEGCSARLMPGKFEYDHDREADDGGDASLENCRCLCSTCHRIKTSAYVTRIRKADRQRDRQIGAIRPKQELHSAGFGPTQRALDHAKRRQDREALAAIAVEAIRERRKGRS